MSSRDAKYGIVVDAGSSGSRLHVYQFYLDPTSAENEEIQLRSVPNIIINDDWNSKVTPGLSSFEHHPDKVYKKHIKPLLKHAESVIPKDEWSKTPIFIQATAGMRLVPEKKRNKIMGNICKNLKKEGKWLMDNCETQIQVIDGELEGVYGWLALNYLSGNLDNYEQKDGGGDDGDTGKSVVEHDSVGFMDMGGASTQIAFSPLHQSEIESHKEYMSEVILANLNGEFQKWDIFVSTWLGFGANQARKRYLSQLINLLPENVNDYDDDDFQTKILVDPCLPHNAEQEFKYKNKYKFTIKGSGNYEQCSKSIYPLLLKNLSCDKEPCLFNGVHAPNIDFFNDKFVGVSEYWYTANDIFKLGGEYNFETFSENVQKFCESEWDDITKLSSQGQYNNIPDDFLLDSCFKANWILNVLHEGFNLPRIGIDSVSKNSDDIKTDHHNENTHINKHVPFQSVAEINGNELSWTLGKILLYACSLINTKSADQTVGVLPSLLDREKTGKSFIAGSISAQSQNSSPSQFLLSSTPKDLHYVMLFGLFVVLCVLGYSIRRSRNGIVHKSLSILSKTLDTVQYGYETCKLKVYSRLKPAHAFSNGSSSHGNSSVSNITSFDTARLSELENGGINMNKNPRNTIKGEEYQMRSRSMINLHNQSASHNDHHKFNESAKHSSNPKSFVSLTDFKNFK